MVVALKISLSKENPIFHSLVYVLWLKKISLFYLLLHTLTFFLLCSQYDNTFLFFFTLQHQVKPQELSSIYMLYQKKKKSRENPNVIVSFFALPSKQKPYFFLLVSLSILQLLFSFSHYERPLGPNLQILHNTVNF